MLNARAHALRRGRSFEDLEGTGNKLNFRKVVVTKCQEEFESGAQARKLADEREAAEKAPAADADGAKAEEGKEEELEEGEVVEGALRLVTAAARGCLAHCPVAVELFGRCWGALKEAHNASSGCSITCIAVCDTSMNAWGGRAESLEVRRAKKAAYDSELKARRRAMGNMQFVGHLYRSAMITEKIVNLCVQQLLNDPMPEELECVCKLLRTVGANLEARPTPPALCARAVMLQPRRAALVW